MRKIVGHALLWMGMLPVCLSCERAEESAPIVSRASPIVPLDTGTVLIQSATDTFSLRVEIAETPDQTRIGLMERDALPEEEGMIFVYSEAQDPDNAFWMFRTRIPLDIAYFDADGVIVAVLQMEPCGSRYPIACEKYPPGVAYSGALEVNRGYFTARGIQRGARVVLRRTGAAAAAAAADAERAEDRVE